MAGTLLRLTGARRGFRMSWLIVGIVYLFPRPFPDASNSCSNDADGALPAAAGAPLKTEDHGDCRGRVVLSNVGRSASATV
jgi:hypothetical protein